MAKLFSLPTGFLAGRPDGSKGKGGGCIQGTASEACLVAVLAARARAMEELAEEEALNLVAYCSDQAHSCVKKACMVAGVHHLRILTCTGCSSTLPNLQRPV